MSPYPPPYGRDGENQTLDGKHLMEGRGPTTQRRGREVFDKNEIQLKSETSSPSDKVSAGRLETLVS